MAASGTRWLVKRGGVDVVGCDNINSLRSLAGNGLVRRDDLVFSPVLQRWMAAEKVKGLAGAFPEQREKARSAVREREARPSHLAPAIAVCGFVLALAAAFVTWRSDVSRLEAWILAAHIVKAQGAVLDKASDAMYPAAATAATAEAASFSTSERGKTGLFSLALATRGLVEPRLLKRGLVRDLDTAMRAYVASLASPRPSRAAQAQQVSDARDALEQALVALEPAVSQDTVSSAKSSAAARAVSLDAALSFAGDISTMQEKAAQAEAKAREVPVPTVVPPTPVPTITPIPTIWARLPASFDGLAWGARFPTEGFVESRTLKDGTRGYRREGDGLRFGEVSLLDAVYLGRRGAFTGLHLEAAADRHDALLEAAIQAWGPVSPQFATRVRKPAWATKEGHFAFLEMDKETNRSRLVIGSKDYF